jgi:hypothetical protein
MIREKRRRIKGKEAQNQGKKRRRINVINKPRNYRF